jgi:hypothetical protein
MQLAPIEKGERDTYAWEYEDELESAGDGDSVLIPDDVQSVIVTLIPTAGTGKIQSTSDKLDTVKNDPGSVTWIDWDLGVVAVPTQDKCDPPTAIRQVNATGTTKMTVRAQ